MIKRISYIDPMQAGKIAAFLYFIFALLVAVPVLLFAPWLTPGAVPGQAAEPPPLYFIATLPFMYAVMGFIVVPIVCVVYNWIAARIGGVEIRLEDRPPGPELKARDTIQPQ